MENTDKDNLPANMDYPSYPQPEVGYSGPTAASYQTPPPYQEQQQHVVMNNQPVGVAPVVFVGAPPVSLFGATALSCFVTWC